MVDPYPADRRAQRCHRCYQGKVAFGRRWPVSHQTNKDCFPPHAYKHARGLSSARLWKIWLTKATYSYVTTKVCDAKFAMCTERRTVQILEPAPSADVVISRFRNKKRQHINTSAGNSCPVPGQSGERSKTSSKHDEKESYHCTSLGGQDIQSTHSHPDHLPLPVSLEPKDDLAHTHQCCDYSISQAAEQSGESQLVLTKLMFVAWRARGEKLPPLRTLVGPELHYGQISMTQKDGTPPVPRRNAYNGTWYIAWPLSMVAQSSSVPILVVLGLVRSLWWNMGTKLGRIQLHVQPVGRFSRTRASLESRVETLLLPGLKSQVWRLGAKRCVNSLGV